LLSGFDLRVLRVLCGGSRGLDPDLRFVKPRTTTSRASAWFGKPIGPEHEPALLAPRRLDDDAVSGRPSRADGMPEIVFDITPAETQLARERRHGTRLRRQRLHEIAAKRHVRF
jgi:hypothetical protein